MSGRAFEKTINANANEKKDVTKLPKKQEEPVVFEKEELDKTIKRRLWWLNIMMFLFHTSFAAVTLVLGKISLNVPIYRITLTPNITISNLENYNNFTVSQITNKFPNWEDQINEFLKVSTEKQNFTLPMTWLVATFFFLSAFFHIGNSVLWWKYYISYMEEQQSPFRWMEYTLSASVMILIVSYGAGVRIDVDLFMLFVLIATTMFFGHLTEVINKRSTTEDKWTLPLGQRLTPHLMGYLPQISAWVVIVYTFTSNSGDAPDFVTAIIWTELALFFSFGFVQLTVILRPPSKYVQGEVAYQVLSLLSKGLLGVIMMVNVIFLGSWTCIVDEIKDRLPSDYC
jgi:hypothetical protein